MNKSILGIGTFREREREREFMTKTPLGTLRHTKNKKIDRFSVQFYTSVKSPVIAFFTESLAPARLDTYYDDMTDRERER